MLIPPIIEVALAFQRLKEDRKLGAATVAKEKDEQPKFATQAKVLTEQCAHYEREHGDSSGVKAVLDDLAASGDAEIGAGAVQSGNCDSDTKSARL